MQEDHFKNAVSIATLGSIGILIASFIQKLEFVEGKITFLLFMISGLLFVLIAGFQLMFSFFEIDVTEDWRQVSNFLFGTAIVCLFAGTTFSILSIIIN